MGWAKGGCSDLLYSPTLQLSELHTRVQQCLDIHFAQAGQGALPQIENSSPDAPLCSGALLELENGLNRILQDRCKVIILKREEIIIAVLYYPGETWCGIPEQARALLNQGWMGWRELEHREAEILTRSFGERMRL